MSASVTPKTEETSASVAQTIHSKQYYTTTNRFEVSFGYHRAVRKGPFIFVSGTTSLVPETGLIEHAGDAGRQADRAMRRCVEAVEHLGGRLADVVRVRMFVARHEDVMAVGQAFRDCFGSKGQESSEVGAAATMLVVKEAFVDPEMLVEIEVDAVLG